MSQKRFYIIQLPSGLFFTEVSPGTHQPVAETEEKADFYTEDQAKFIASAYTGATVRQGSAGAYTAFLGRLSGRIMTHAKRRANRERARKPRKDKSESTDSK